MNLLLRSLLFMPGMQDLCRLHPEYSALQLLDAEADWLYHTLISDENDKLLKIAFCSNLNQADLDAFIKDWDIEKMSSEKALLIAYVMKRRPDLDFGVYNGPRLKGLLNFYRFQNLYLISHFSKIVSCLNKNKIIPLIFKGGAMKYLRPELPRVMGDIDILLDSVRSYNRSKTMVKELGYDFKQEPHSIDLSLPDKPGQGILDIHHYFSFCDEANHHFIKGLFKRARIENVFSAKAYVPLHEDLFFICLNNITRNLTDQSCFHAILLAFFDLFYLMSSKTDFNWDIVFNNILESKSEIKSYLALKFINKIIPNTVPQKFFENKKFINGTIQDTQMLQFYVWYVHDVKYICKKLKFGQEIKSWSRFIYYMKCEIQHFFTKKILHSPLAIKIFLQLKRK